jgi:hypothetical protein
VAMRCITCSSTNPVAVLITTTSTHCYSHCNGGASTHIELSTARDIEWFGAAFSVLQRGTATAGLLEHNTEWRVVFGRVTARRSERVPLSGKYFNSNVTAFSPYGDQREISNLKLRANSKPCFLSFHIHKPKFFPQILLQSFVLFLDQTAVISLYTINLGGFTTEMESVYCAVRTESLHTV